MYTPVIIDTDISNNHFQIATMFICRYFSNSIDILGYSDVGFSNHIFGVLNIMKNAVSYLEHTLRIGSVKKFE